MKSMANLEARQRSIEERLGDRWQPLREAPVFEASNMVYEVAGRVQAVNCGGLGMMQTLVSQVGLGEAIDRELKLFKRHLPYHESDHVLSLVYMVLSGGQCLGDLESRRADEGFLLALGAERIPDPTTAGDFLRRFENGERVEALMTAINQARSRVWHVQPNERRRLARIDVDGTIVETEGETKQRMDVSYDGRWGFGPLVISLANSGEMLYAVNRPASRPSHDGCAPWIDKAVDWALADAGFKKVRVRGDSDFSLTANFDRWTDRGVEFVFGMDAHPSFVRRAEALADSAWRRFRRASNARHSKRRRAPNVKREVVQSKGYRDLTLAEEHVAELEYRPTKAKRSYRLIVLRKKIHVTEGQLHLPDDVRYRFYVTNVSKARLGAAAVVRESNARCNQENLIEQLKNGVQATRLPVREFYGNWAYLVIAALAWNLKAWAGLLLPEDLQARAILRMEFRRFLNEIMLLPAQILTSGRRRIFRLLAINRWSRLLLEGVSKLKQWQFA